MTLAFAPVTLPVLLASVAAILILLWIIWEYVVASASRRHAASEAKRLGSPAPSDAPAKDDRSGQSGKAP